MPRAAADDDEGYSVWNARIALFQASRESSCSGSARATCSKQSSFADRHMHGTYSDASVGIHYSSPMRILLFIVVRGRLGFYIDVEPLQVCSNCLCTCGGESSISSLGLVYCAC